MKRMKETMRAAVFEGEGRLVLKDVPVPKIERPDQMIGKIEVCSICGTDVHMTNVPAGYPATPGTLLGRDRFVVNPNEYCGSCYYCKNNLPNECEKIEAMGIDVDGGFAEYVRVAEKMAFKLPKTLPTPIAAYAEPLACVINGAAKIRVNPAESVCVVGAGPVGLLFIQLLKAAGAKPIIAVEPNMMRREYALKCGADICVDPMAEDVREVVKDLTQIGVDYAIDVVGNQMPVTIDVIRKGGTCLLMGNNARANPNIVQSLITYKEAKVLGTWLANASFGQAVKLLDSGLLNLDFMITHTLPLEEIHEAIDLLRRVEGVEVLVDPNL